MRFPTNIKNINLQKAIVIICCCLFLAQFIFNDASAFAKTEKTTKSSSPLQLNNKSERESEVAANKIFHTSLKLFQDGEYWNCAQELIIIMDFYPQFNKMDKVVNYLGHCLFQEELTMASIRMFNYLLKKYRKSEHIPDALLGLERAFYQQNDYKRTLQVYYIIVKKAQHNKKILSEARYIAGKCHYRLKNYDMAISVLKKVDNRSDFYDGALYSTALSYLKKSNVAIAVDYFRKVTSLPIISGERRNLVDNARLTLGLIYYELNAYKAAIHQLSKISAKHEHYQDALLALGWSYLKLEDYENVIKHLNKLIKHYPNTANAEESYFLLGQAYIALGEYDKSLGAYKTIVNLYPEKRNVPGLIRKVKNNLKQSENQVGNLKVKILIEETKLFDAIPLISGGKEIPKYLIKKKKELRDFREKMIAHLLNERDHLLLMQQSIDKLTKLAERQERRKSWRGYAEYGISRALFLKEMSTSRGN